LLVLTFAFLVAVEKVYNYDIWWHLKTGQWILETGKIPHADPFTFTTPGAPWWPHYWFSDVFFALVLRMGGIDGLILLKALVVATAFLIVFRLMLREGINPFLAVVLVLLAIYIAQFRFLLRPHVFMFPLAAAFFWVLLAVSSSAWCWWVASWAKVCLLPVIRESEIKTAPQSGQVSWCSSLRFYRPSSC
jgi:hypothetical protein